MPKDMAKDRLPGFSFITPDSCHDGHDSPCADGSPGGLAGANAWLSDTVPPMLRYLEKHDGLLLVTFDEKGFTGGPPFGCCTGGPGGGPGFGGRVGLLAVSTRLPIGTEVSTRYDHMSLLRTIEGLFGIDQYLNNASTAQEMTDVVAPTR